MAKTRLVPKGCIVHRIELTPKGADVGFRCGDDAENQAMVARGYRASADTMYQTYPSKFVKGVRGVAHRGIYVSGHGASMGFTLSPASAVCHVGRSGATGHKEIRCSMRGDTSLPSLQGYSRRRSRRRRR